MLKFLIFLLSLGLVYALMQAIRLTSSKNEHDDEDNLGYAEVISPQKLAAIAEPYRQYLGQMIAIKDDIHNSLKYAPEALQHGLGDIDHEVQEMITSVVPQAEQATQLEAQLLRVDNAMQREEWQFRLGQIDKEMQDFVEGLGAVRTRVWRLLDEAKTLSPESTAQKLDEKLWELEALEQAFQELRRS